MLEDYRRQLMISKLYPQDPSPAVADAEKLLIDAEIAYDAKDEMPQPQELESFDEMTEKIRVRLG